MDLAFFSICVTLSLLLLTTPLGADGPEPLARRTLLTLLETRPATFSYEWLGQPRTFRFKSYSQLLAELALLGFPSEFQRRLAEELRNSLDNLLPLPYRLSFRAEGSLEIGKGGNSLLARESITLTIPSLPPRRAELTLELFS